jgi:hypothetical protein
VTTGVFGRITYPRSDRRARAAFYIRSKQVVRPEAEQSWATLAPARVAAAMAFAVRGLPRSETPTFAGASEVGGTGLEPVTPSLSIRSGCSRWSARFAYPCNRALSASYRWRRANPSERWLRALRARNQPPKPLLASPRPSHGGGTGYESRMRLSRLRKHAQTRIPPWSGVPGGTGKRPGPHIPAHTPIRPWSPGSGRTAAAARAPSRPSGYPARASALKALRYQALPSSGRVSDQITQMESAMMRSDQNG